MITPEPWKFYDQFESSDRNLTHTACSAFHIYKSSYLWKFLGSLCDLLTFNSLLDIFLLNRNFENCVEQKVIPPRNCRQNLISLKRHFLTFSIIARIIYALMCQTRYIRSIIKYISRQSNRIYTSCLISQKRFLPLVFSMSLNRKQNSVK